VGHTRKKTGTGLRGRDAPVPLAVAASLVYFQFRRPVAMQSDDALQRILNDAARALSQLADVYYEEAPGRIARIPHADLIGGAFCNGAREFRASNGRTYRDLALRRLDLMNALDVLEKANTALASVRTSEGPGSGPRTQAPRGS